MNECLIRIYIYACRILLLLTYSDRITLSFFLTNCAVLLQMGYPLFSYTNQVVYIGIRTFKYILELSTPRYHA